MYALVYEIAVKVDTVRLTSLYSITPLYCFPGTTDESICMVSADLSNQNLPKNTCSLRICLCPLQTLVFLVQTEHYTVCVIG